MSSIEAGAIIGWITGCLMTLTVVITVYDIRRKEQNKKEEKS